MADTIINYKDVINAATKGFRNIQNAINGVDSTFGAVVPSGTTYSNNKTPDQMVTEINKFAIIDKSNSSGAGTDSGGFITKKVGYHAYSDANPTLTFDSATRKITASKAISAGYYTAGTISGTYTIDAGSVSENGGTVTTKALASLSEEVTNAFVPTAVVSKGSGTNDTSYSYAKIERTAVTRDTSAGYISTANGVNAISAATLYVKIPNIVLQKTDASITLKGEVTQKEFAGDTEQNGAAGVFEDNKPSGESTPYYKFEYTPSRDINTYGKGSVKTAGYGTNQQTDNINVNVSTTNKTTKYIRKSTASSVDSSGVVSTSALNYGKAIKISAGYYPTDRYITTNFSAASIKATNEINKDSSTFYNGSTTVSTSEIVLTSSTSLANTRYYTIKAYTTVDKEYTTPGYISSSVGTFTVPSRKDLYLYLPELQATIGITKSLPSVTHSQDNIEGTLLYKLESSDTSSPNYKSGIVKSISSDLEQQQGTQVWRVQSKVASSSAGSATASVTINRAGYIGAVSTTPEILAPKNQSIPANTYADSNATFYVKRAAITASGDAAQSNINLGKPSISVLSPDTDRCVNSTGGVTTSRPSGYYVSFQSGTKTGSTTVSPKATVTQGGYLPYSSTPIQGNAVSISANVEASQTHYFSLRSGVSHNGYVTTSGWFAENTQIYKTVYDSNEECVDFIFND